MFDQFVILSRSEEREEAAVCLKDEKCHRRVWSRQQRDEDFPESVRSLMKIRNKMGPRTLPWDTPALTGTRDERGPLRSTRCL